MSLDFGDALQIAIVVCLAALAVDRWIHGREFNERKLLEDVRDLKENFTNASRRSSQREGKVQRAINGLKLDMREVQTTLKIQPRPYEPYDID